METTLSLTEQDRKRYHRQMMIAGWQETGQLRLKSAEVFIAGAGGLGSPAAIYLAVAGVGRIRICDFDSPDLSNLNRQILHNDSRIGVNKAESARQSLQALNPSIEVEAITTRIEPENADALVGDAQIILDCMDNFPTRYALNECALRKGIPLVHGAVWGLEGRLTFLHSPETPCFACLYPSGPPKELFPVLGAVPGVIGCLQAVETLKYLTGTGVNLRSKLLVWDGSDMSFSTFRLSRDAGCAVCGNPS